MDYGWHIVPGMSPEEVNELLKKHYGFPLLRFANIVVDVFSKISFFPKGFGGVKRKDLHKQKDELYQIKRTLIDKLDRYHREYVVSRYPKYYASIMKKKIEADREAYYGSEYHLQDFIKRVDFSIDIWNEFFELVDQNKKNPKRKINLPYFGEKLRDISDVRQIFILFSLMIKSAEANEYRSRAFVHWEKIVELIAWFEKKLRKCSYGIRLNINGLSDIQSIKYFCRKKTKIFRTEFDDQMIPRYFYTSTTRCLGLNLIKIVFYKDRIKTVFRDDNKIEVLITRLDQTHQVMRPPKNLSELEPDGGYVLEISDSI